MKKLWNKFTLATGKDAELNSNVKTAYYIFIENHPQLWPTKITIGRKLAENTIFLAPGLQGWYNGMGEIVPVEIIDGSELKVY